MFIAAKVSPSLIKDLQLLHDQYLEELPLSIPSEIIDAYAWYGNSGCKFSGNKKLLEPENIMRHAVQTREVFKVKNWYEIFAHISEIVHGNPNYQDEPHNERFWIATMSMSTTAYMIELIDRLFLEKVQPRDFREWLKTTKDIQPQMIAEWKKKI